jgi:hypothetical protein
MGGLAEVAAIEGDAGARLPLRLGEDGRWREQARAGQQDVAGGDHPHRGLGVGDGDELVAAEQRAGVGLAGDVAVDDVDVLRVVEVEPVVVHVDAVVDADAVDADEAAPEDAAAVVGAAGEERVAEEEVSALIEDEQVGRSKFPPRPLPPGPHRPRCGPGKNRTGCHAQPIPSRNALTILCAVQRN